MRAPVTKYLQLACATLVLYFTRMINAASIVASIVYTATGIDTWWSRGHGLVRGCDLFCLGRR